MKRLVCHTIYTVKSCGIKLVSPRIYARRNTVDFRHGFVSRPQVNAISLVLRERKRETELEGESKSEQKMKRRRGTRQGEAEGTQSLSKSERLSVSSIPARSGSPARLIYLSPFLALSRFLFLSPWSNTGTVYRAPTLAAADDTVNDGERRLSLDAARMIFIQDSSVTPRR